MKTFICITLLFFQQDLFAQVAGTLDWPLRPISKYQAEGAHFDYYGTPYNGYHAGQDFNSEDGDDCNHKLFALGDGEVVYVQNDPNALAGKGKTIIVRYKLTNGVTDVVYNHANRILVPWRDASGNNSIVDVHDAIATIGNTGGVPCHLHTEAQVDLNIPVAANPYFGGVNSKTGLPREPLTVAAALRYTSPSLLIDDRTEENIQLIQLKYNAWTIFTAENHTPSALSFIYNPINDQQISVKDAASLNLIDGKYRIIWKSDDGTWHYYSNSAEVVFEKGRQYAIWAKKAFLEMNIVTPGYRHEDERARQDMMHALHNDGMSDALVNTETYREIPGWSGSYDLSVMSFTSSDGKTIWANQAHNFNKPTLRFTTYRDPDTLQWKPWVRVDPNLFR